MPDNDGVLDLSRLVEAFEDDTAGIAELLQMALDTGAKHLRALDEGLTAGDAAVVARAAHSIKGSAGNIGAVQVAALATALDQRARTGDLAGAEDSIEGIRAAYARLGDEVERYRVSIA